MNPSKVLTPLTNRKIDRYALQGTYGSRRRKHMLAHVASGRCKVFDSEIRQGLHGEEAQRALASRKTISRVKQEESVADMQAEAVAKAFALLGIEPPSVSVGVTHEG